MDVFFKLFISFYSFFVACLFLTLLKDFESAGLLSADYFVPLQLGVECEAEKLIKD